MSRVRHQSGCYLIYNENLYLVSCLRGDQSWTWLNMYCFFSWSPKPNFTNKFLSYVLHSRTSIPDLVIHALAFARSPRAYVTNRYASCVMHNMGSRLSSTTCQNCKRWIWTHNLIGHWSTDMLLIDLSHSFMFIIFTFVILQAWRSPVGWDHQGFFGPLWKIHPTETVRNNW